MAEQVFKHIEPASKYKPYVHPDTARDIHFSLVAPEFRVGNPGKGDPMVGLIGNIEAQWAFAAEELEAKARSAEVAGSEDADGLIARTERAKINSGYMRYLWWPEDKDPNAVSYDVVPSLFRHEGVPVTTTGEDGLPLFMFSDGSTDTKSMVGGTPHMPNVQRLPSDYYDLVEAEIAASLVSPADETMFLGKITTNNIVEVEHREPAMAAA